MSTPIWEKRVFRIIAILSLLSCICIIDVTPVSAITIIVNTTNDELIDDSICSLREAMYAAKNLIDYYGCTGGASAYITLPAGIYTVDDSFDSINTAITIEGVSASTTIIQASNCVPTEESCANDYQFISVSADGTLNLNHLTLRNWKNIDDNNGSVIYNTGTLNISNCIIASNRERYGGAINNFIGGYLTVTDSTFLSNMANDSSGINSGGAIFNSSFGFVFIERSTFASNSAANGGAIMNYGDLGIINSTFSNNIASNYGGAINNQNIIDITNSTFSDNAAGSGAGIYNAGELNFINTVIANSPSGDDCLNEGFISTYLNNLVEDGTCLAAYVGDPLLSPLADNSGPTQTYALQAGSPAIDIGDLEACPATDQRGVHRPQWYGCDIGAYEWEPFSFFLPLILK